MIKMISRYLSENYLDYLRYLDISISVAKLSNYFTYSCSKVTHFLIKAPLLRCATIMNKVLCIIYYFLMSIIQNH